MKIKSILSLILIGVLAFGAGLGTYAWFTRTIESDLVEFKAGTLDIDINAEPIDISGLWYPSRSVIGNVTVSNIGNLDLQYRFRVEYDSEHNPDSLNDLSNVLRLIVKDSQSKEIFNGTLEEIVRERKNFPARTLNTSLSETLSITLKMDESAGNNYMGAITKVVFIAEATQTQNTNWEGSF